MVPGCVRHQGSRLWSALSFALLMLAFHVGTASFAISTPGAHGDEKSLRGDRRLTRFVVGLDRAVDFQVFSIAAPNRVIVDLPEVKMQLPQVPLSGPVGLVRSFRGGLIAPGKLRLIIDVTDAVVVEKATVEQKDGKSRLVLEIVPAEVTRPGAKKALPPAIGALGAIAVQPPMPQPVARTKLKKGPAFRPVIVLDPGHGGHDSGAQRFGTVEKEVVLAFAKALKARLDATGRYQVLLTRDNDRFIPLSERREFAERHKAALFIAIHADYANSSARGATIYSLREGVANELARSVKGERSEQLLTARELEAASKTSGESGAIKGILADLATRETMATRERTGTFVRSVIEYMGRSTNLMGNPDRSATFAVLRTAQVPAVLIELAYVTNQRDAMLLRSDEWRQRVSTSIATAIENYFSHQIARMPM